jgi:hypothetical protein
MKITGNDCFKVPVIKKSMLKLRDRFCQKRSDESGEPSNADYFKK